MFDFSKIQMRPSGVDGFREPAADEQIKELEKYCGHILPENYKIILKNYNGSIPKACYFDLKNEYGTPIQREIFKFFYVDDNKNAPANIWKVIRDFSKYMGANTLPFADDGNQQIYYFKWVNNIPEIWFLAYLELETPRSKFIMNDFEDLLEALYYEE